MEQDDFIITRQHMRTVRAFGNRKGYCATGGRRWFAAHNMDWADFLKNGIPASTVQATGDALGIALVEHARKEIANGR